jgi:hypothetical protein
MVRNIKVKVDGQVVGRLGYGEDREYQVTSGSHEVRVGFSFPFRVKKVVDIAEDGTTVVELLGSSRRGDDWDGSRIRQLSGAPPLGVTDLWDLESPAPPVPQMGQDDNGGDRAP